MVLVSGRNRFNMSLTTATTKVYYFTPGNLSQVPPAKVLIVGCDRHTEVPVTVEIKTIKCRNSSVLVKFIITREFFENQRVPFDH